MSCAPIVLHKIFMASYRYLSFRAVWKVGLLVVFLSACSPISPVSFLFPSATPTQTATAVRPTVTPTATPTATPTPTLTPTPRTPPLLPALYQNDGLTPFGTPHTYIQDTCQYLHNKWSSASSTPGTVVMVIMFHSITNGALTNPNQASEFGFRTLMKTLYDDGFQAITTAQLAGFMENNAMIPERSALLVTDDRHPAQYFNALFREYWDKYGWPVVNAWISTDLTTADLWKQQEELNSEGWVDYQAHGYIHNIPIGPDSSEEYILGELQKPIDIFMQHFNKKPIAIIWPGGGFTPHAANVARRLGYRLGFTVNPRGPLMYNWVPLGDESTPVHPGWIPEGPVDDPLMVLPRYWDTDAIIHIPQVIQIGQEATAYAQANKSTELEYYDIVCSASYGAIP